MAQNWNRKLARLVRAKSGKDRIVDLRTVGDARDYVAGLPETSTLSEQWQGLAQRLFDVAGGEDPEQATLQLETMLIHRNLLVLH